MKHPLPEGEDKGEGEGATDELLAAYAATAERWHALRTNARAANPVFDENARLGMHVGKRRRVA